jgi:hypothetical protein
MAKASKQSKKSGPHLAAAFFCEGIIEDANDHSLSAIRIVDTFRIVLPPTAPEGFPSETNRLPVHISGLLSFKTGDSPGEHVVRLVAESPSGKKQTVLEQTITLTDAPQGGTNVRLHQVLAVKSRKGLFWIHVYLDGKRVTRMPLHISVDRAEEDSSQPSDGRPS